MDFCIKIEELKRSPIFALSKCNHELAHSNFWAWLIEYEDDQKNHPFLKLFVPDSDIVFDNVTREEKNRDLTIYYHKKDEPKESRCHIVENKLKSIPTVKQLERYEKEIEEQHKGQFKGGTLTGIEETLDLGKLNKWHFVSYDELAQAIEEIADEQKVEKDRQVIEQYIKDIANVSYVLKTAQQRLGERWLLSDEDLFNKLEEVKLGDVFLKQTGCLLKKKIDFSRYCGQGISTNR